MAILDELWPRGIPRGYFLNLFTLPLRDNRFLEHIPTSDGLWNLCGQGTQDAYFGVGLGSIVPNRKQRYTQSDIQVLPAVFADLDFKNGQTREQVLNFVQHLPEPTAIVDTGGGLHAYWCFNKPVVGTENIAHVLSGWKGYIEHRSIDLACQVDSMVIEPARVLRLDGFPNLKPERNRVLVSVLSRGGPRYDVDELPFLWPAQTQAIIPHSMNGTVGDGERNWMLYKFSCYLRGYWNVNSDQLLAIAHSFNDNVIQPPLDDHELTKLVGSAMKRKGEWKFRSSALDNDMLSALYGRQQ